MTDPRPAATATPDASTGPAAARLWFGVIGATLVAAALSGCGPGASGGGDMSPEAVARRIQPVGMVELRPAGAGGGVPKTGEQVYTAQCTACHATGAAGAPKLGDAAAWAPRIKTGYDALLASALKGKGNMPPQGGGAFSEFEIGRALVHMANQSGAKLDEPKAPAAAASAAASGTK